MKLRRKAYKANFWVHLKQLCHHVLSMPTSAWLPCPPQVKPPCKCPHKILQDIHPHLSLIRIIPDSFLFQEILHFLHVTANMIGHTLPVRDMVLWFIFHLVNSIAVPLFTSVTLQCPPLIRGGGWATFIIHWGIIFIFLHIRIIWPAYIAQ